MAGNPKKKQDLILLGQLGQEPIGERLEQGKSLTAICTEFGISKKALNEWLEMPEQAGLLSRARVRASHELVNETLEIADTATPEQAQVARLRIEARRWVASKWNASAYADQKNAQVIVNIGDLHLRALKDPPVITIQSTPVDGSSEIIDAGECDSIANGDGGDPSP